MLIACTARAVAADDTSFESERADGLAAVGTEILEMKTGMRHMQVLNVCA